MIDAISLHNAHLLGDALPSAHRLRHRIFIQRQKYDVPAWCDMEWDQFDTPAATYLLWRDARGEVRGLVRVIPTTLPYMIQQLWPELVADGTLPVADDVWEVTRFGIDRDLHPRERTRAFGELFCALGEFGMQRGIREYLFVTPDAVIEKALGRAGVPWQRLGETRRLGSLPVCAAQVAVNRDSLQKLRAHHQIPGPVLRVPGEDAAMPEHAQPECRPVPACAEPRRTGITGCVSATASIHLRFSQKLSVSWKETVSTAFRLDPDRLPRDAFPGALSCNAMRGLSMNQCA